MTIRRLALLVLGGAALGAGTVLYAWSAGRSPLSAIEQIALPSVLLGNVALPLLALRRVTRPLVAPAAAVLLPLLLVAAALGGALYYAEHLPLTRPGSNPYYDPDGLRRSAVQPLVFTLLSAPMLAVALASLPAGGRRLRLAGVAVAGVFLAATLVMAWLNRDPPDYPELTVAASVISNAIAVLALVVTVVVAREARRDTGT